MNILSDNPFNIPFSDSAYLELFSSGQNILLSPYCKELEKHWVNTLDNIDKAKGSFYQYESSIYYSKVIVLSPSNFNADTRYIDLPDPNVSEYQFHVICLCNAIFKVGAGINSGLIISSDKSIRVVSRPIVEINSDGKPVFLNTMKNFNEFIDSSDGWWLVVQGRVANLDLTHQEKVREILCLKEI